MIEKYYLLGEIIEPLINLFMDSTIDLNTQLHQLSKLAHLMLIIYRRQRTKFITNALYNDIQSIVQDAFISAVENNPDNKLYLYQLGTDQLEQLFSSVRTITHAKNCDLLELQDRLKMSSQIENVYAERPGWRKTSRLSI